MLNCINDRRLMFCALYKYLNGDNRFYCAEYVHYIPEKYYDCDAVIRFTSIDPDSKNPDNPNLMTLYVWLSFHHGIVILDPDMDEMMIIGEKEIELYKQMNTWGIVYRDNEMKSKQLKDIYNERIFHPVFDLILNLRRQFNDKKCDDIVNEYCKETEEKMRILPPYHIINPTCTWREKCAAKNCRYMMTMGLIELMKRLSTHLDKQYVPTTVDGSANIKTDFQTFTDEFEVYWMKMYHVSTVYWITAFFCSCYDNGTIRLTVPGFTEDIEIVQVDQRSFICMPFPNVDIKDMNTMKSLVDERWCQIFRQELTEYLANINIKNEYAGGECDDEEENEQ